MRRRRYALAAPALVVLALTLTACGLRPGPAPPDLHGHPFLVCTRSIESDRSDANGNGLHDAGYGAISPGGTYRGAYQFVQSTWDRTAEHAGWTDLIGQDPAAQSVDDQDQMAWHLYEWQGSGPWGGRCG